MPGTRFVQTWQQAARELELHVTPWRVVLLPSAKCLVADLWVEGFGSPRGMLLFGQSGQIGDYGEELMREAWAYTVLGFERDVAESHEAIMQRLRTWGWYGAPEGMPGWLIGA
ncbi:MULTISPECIES: hypothetical protein [Oleiagrimonas]|uniref:Uncharacterized protein n=1 Tax=Oleiagrimonas citrea TaxID=1665687 RepID=A0A846ZI63_9GAMM|nr:MULTISPECIES: hypothetical protein [Oleiagrimonas]NKZ37796.1 hypothetical protein [Oleiagrimonas citrea]RAP57304.1 hypothetical protein BTJ49_09450 [Oleiagrimonas sp. MCCC 1A03011]